MRALLAATALLLPVRSFQQFLFAASFAVALATMWLWGRRFARSILGVSDPGPCTAVYLGQFVLLAAATVGTAVNGSLAVLLGHALPLAGVIVPATLVVLILEARVWRKGAGLAEAGPPDLLGLLGLGSLAAVIAIFSGHLSAVGLDTHEHTAWVRQILACGFIPLAEPGTGILGDYPRTFHLLTALWNAAGLAPPAGPFVKVMPFLQAALPALTAGELLIVSTLRGGPIPSAGEAFARNRWRISVALAFWAYAFWIVAMVYPAPDLSGTPRLSGSGLLLLPVTLVLFSFAHRSGPAGLLALASLPLVAAWAVSWHPVTAILLVVATLPLGASLVALARPGFSRQGAFATCATCLALAGAVVVQDPWTVSRAVSASPGLAGLLRAKGLVGYGEAVKMGLASDREKAVRRVVPVAPCHDLPCVARAMRSAAGEAAAVPVRTARSTASDLRGLATSPSAERLEGLLRRLLPFQPSAVTAPALLPFLLVVGGGALVALGKAIRRAPGLPRTNATPAECLLAGSLVGVGAAGLGLQFSGALARVLSDHGPEMETLVEYLRWAGHALSIGFLWVPFLAAWSVLASSFVVRPAGSLAARLGRGGRAGALAAGMGLWLALPLVARLGQEDAIRHAGFSTPIGLEDLRALRRIEEEIPPGEAVVVPADHFVVGGVENWLIPTGDTTALLPYGDRKYLFNVYLGASYPLSWRDLTEGLCAQDPASRNRFFARSGARWLVARDTIERDPEQVVKHVRICGERLDVIGAQLPPIRSDRGIFLFRLRGP